MVVKMLVKMEGSNDEFEDSADEGGGTTFHPN